MKVRTMLLWLAVLAAIIPGNAVTAFAYRPLGTEDAGVAGKGVAQLELSWDYIKWNGSDREQVFLAVPIYGLTDRLELSAEIPRLVHRFGAEPLAQGSGDINLVAKYLLMPERDGSAAVAVKGVVKMDNGDFDRGLGSGDRDYSFFAVASRTLGNLSVHGHIGYTWVGDAKDPELRNIYLYGLALDYGFTDAFHVVGEINGNRHPDRSEETHPRVALLGVTYKIFEKLTVDLGVRAGLTKTAPDWSTTAGLSMTF